MEHIVGTARGQIILFPETIDDYVTEENPVRFIDAFVDKLDMIKLNFKHAVVASTGTPPYNPKDLLKLYIYGMLNRIRASRMLERETKRNVEVMWLIRKLSPDHKTISDFRKDNPEALKETFKEFVLLCMEMGLFGKELVAIDSSKFKASNARDRVLDKEGVEKSLKKIEESIGKYLEELDRNDARDNGKEDAVSKEELQKKIEILKSRKTEMETAKENLDASDEKYVSLTDEESRLIKDKNGIEVGYRVQTVADEKNAMVSDYEVTNDASDHHHLSSMASSAKETLGVGELTVCADAGYYDDKDIKKCDDDDVTVYVPIPDTKLAGTKEVPTREYYVDKFSYDKEKNAYTCPEANTLSYYRTVDKGNGKMMHIYRTLDKCEGCKVRNLCTTSERGRQVARWEHEDVIDKLKERLNANPDIMRQRKKTIEHIFGTIKRAWGCAQLLSRGIKKISGEVALMFLAYNMTRAISILGTKSLVGHLSAGGG